MLFAMGTGILSAFTILIVLYRLGLRKFMGYPAILDAAVVFLLAFLLHGTFGGITAAITGGLFFSLAITVIRKYYGYSRYSIRQRQWVTTYGELSQLINGDKKCSFPNLKLSKRWPLYIVGLFLLLSVL